MIELTLLEGGLYGLAALLSFVMMRYRWMWPAPVITALLVVAAVI